MVNIKGQPVESILYKREIGISLGNVVYFGDLNPNYNFKVLKPNLQIFYKINKFFFHRVGVKFALDYNYLEYADANNDGHFIELRERNLSFKNETFGISTQLTFDLLNLNPGSSDKWFTPYINAGIGLIYSNPFDYDSKKNAVYLRPLITERTNIYDKTPIYSNFVFVSPLTIGFKFSLNKKINIFFEGTYTYAFTDYLDDVSKNYASKAAFTNNQVANYFQDRSVNQKYGVSGKRRGIENTGNDAYFSFQIGVSWNDLISCCPPMKELFN